MKWLVGLFVVWIVLRSRFNEYAALSGDKASASADVSGPADRLKALMDLF